MSENEIPLTFSQKDQRRYIRAGGITAPTVAELVAAVPALGAPEHLGRYVEALNYLARGEQYRPIHDAAAFRAEYEKRYQAEDPSQHFREGEPQLHRFGHSELDEVQRARVEGATVIFYVEHEYLGVPYRVTGPAPGQPDCEIKYMPLPTAPPEEPQATAAAETP